MKYIRGAKRWIASIKSDNIESNTLGPRDHGIRNPNVKVYAIATEPSVIEDRGRRDSMHSGDNQVLQSGENQTWA
jgi:hypothetical protein